MDNSMGIPAPAAKTSIIVEVLVLLAIALVAAACGAGLYVEAGFTLWQAAALGSTVFVFFAGLHFLVRRASGSGDPADTLSEADIDLITAEIAKLNNATRGNYGEADAKDAPSSAGGAGSKHRAASRNRETPPVAVVAPLGAAVSQQSGGSPPRTAAGTPPPLPGTDPHVAWSPTVSASGLEPVKALAAADASGHGLWPHEMPPLPHERSQSERPGQRGTSVPASGAERAVAGEAAQGPVVSAEPRGRDGGLPSLATRKKPAVPPATPRSAAPSFQEAASSKTPLPAKQEIQDTVVEVGNKMRENPAPADATATGAGPQPQTAPARPFGDAQANNVLEASLEALRATADVMRAAEAKSASRRAPAPEAAPQGSEQRPAPKQVPKPASPMRSSAPGGRTNLGQGQGGIQGDILLEPILNLEDRHIRHYAASLRVRAANGTAPAAAATAGLDTLRLVRTAQLARLLSERGKAGFIFFEAGRESLSSEEFLGELAVLAQQPAAWVRQIVPVFCQKDTSAFTSQEWDALRNIGTSGLCFSVQSIETMDTNFAALKTWGFEFAQISAARLLAGLPGKSGIVSAADIIRKLIGAGLTPIVTDIEDDASLAPILAAGAHLGRGPLFGAPRPVKSEALTAAPAGPVAA